MTHFTPAYDGIDAYLPADTPGLRLLLPSVAAPVAAGMRC